MKSLFILLVAALAIPGLVGAGYGQATSPTSPAAKPAAKTAPVVRNHRLTGEVVSIDASAKTVVVKAPIGHQTKEYAFSAVDKAASELATLKAGSGHAPLHRDGERADREQHPEGDPEERHQDAEQARIVSRVPGPGAAPWPAPGRGREGSHSFMRSERSES